MAINIKIGVSCIDCGVCLRFQQPRLDERSEVWDNVLRGRDLAPLRLLHTKR